MEGEERRFNAEDAESAEKTRGEVNVVGDFLLLDFWKMHWATDWEANVLGWVNLNLNPAIWGAIAGTGWLMRMRTSLRLW